MEVALVTVSYCRETNKEIKREVKEVQQVDEDKFYRPLVEMLGDAFLEYYKDRKED